MGFDRSGLLMKLNEWEGIAQAVQEYAESHLFDAFGIMMSGIDSHCDKPFERGFITADKLAYRAGLNPWAYWTYEDSIMSMGLYIEGLVYQYEIAGRDASLERAKEVYATVRNVYYQSQLHGIGCFIRPYGGYHVMEQFNEPLGTDQAGPLFAGLYRLLPYLAEKQQDELVNIVVKTLGWYADQGYRYWYYKSLIHEWEPPLHHSSTFFLPALAFAAERTGDKRWQEDLDYYLKRQLSGGEFTLAKSFRFGSELLILREILGERFDVLFTQEKTAQMRRECEADLAEYDQAGFMKYIHRESQSAGFEPYTIPLDEAPNPLGAPVYNARHAGRCKPRHEIAVLTALASLGAAGVAEKAGELLFLSKRVPEDFTNWISEDYDKIPATAHLYARSTGIVMVNWWRDYWMLKWVVSSAG